MRKRTRRTVYKLIDPVSHAIVGAMITAPEVLDKLRLGELSSIEAFRTGKATKQDWHTINDMANISETMARNGIGIEALPASELAHEHLKDAYERFKRTGKLGISGPALQAFRECFEYHDLQRMSIPRSQYEDMIRKTRERIISKAPDVLTLT